MVRFYTCPFEVELPIMMSWHSDFNESSHIILIIQSRLPCKNLI